MKLIFSLFILLSVSFNIFSQNDSLQTKPEVNDKHTVFANIFTGAYYNFNTIQPNAGFDLSTALLGYSYKKSNTLKFTLIYDVTRTTSGISVTDSTGNNYNVLYFEGSSYTAFLKMAEIKWQFSKKISLSAGQLLNEQYLTVTDKFWKHRYVLTTMQELYRMGYPADFGLRFEYKDEKTFALSLGAVNGDGPFRKQDDNAVIEYTTNLEIYYIKNLLIKAFVSLTPATFDVENNLKTVFSGFLAYKVDKYRIGTEYSYTNNVNFNPLVYSGFSIFAMYDITNKFEVFGRYDYIDNSKVIRLNNTCVAGIQYEPEKNLFLSLNYRFWSALEMQQVYFNMGVKF